MRIPFKRKNEKVLRPVHPNVGIRIAYRGKLLALIDEMQASYLYWLRACYRANEPKMAMDAQERARVASLFASSFEDEKSDMAFDATPAAELAATIRKLGRRWQRNFNEGAPELARWFATKASRRSDLALRAILRKAGYSVQFQMTATMRDVLRGSIEENVGLIKSIASEYHSDVQGLVMRSVTRGRDLEYLSKELRKRYGITRERANLISLDQNNKATSAMMATRQTDLGIEEGVWMHSHAGKEPRPTHLANDGERFSIKDGWFDPDPRVRRRIWPGELIRCRCTWKPVVKGFS